MTIHLSKLLDLVQVLLLALSQAGEDLAVAWVRVPARRCSSYKGRYRGQCNAPVGLAKATRVLRSLWLQRISFL